MDKGTVLTMLIAIGAPALSSILAALIAKFVPRQKLADNLWAIIYKGLLIIEKVADLRIGGKAREIIEESILGTIAYCMRVIGQRIENYLLKNDTDGSVK